MSAIVCGSVCVCVYTSHTCIPPGISTARSAVAVEEASVAVHHQTPKDVKRGSYDLKKPIDNTYIHQLRLKWISSSSLLRSCIVTQ